MIRLLLMAVLIMVVARAFWRVMDGVIEAAGGRRAPGRNPTRAVKLQRDPVCGTFVAPGTALTLPSGNTTLYFCSDRCRDAYRAEHR